MKVFNEFMNCYGMTIIYAALTALAGILGSAFKKIFKKYFDDKTKKSVAKTCVKAVEQIYKDLHGEEKYQKCVESMAEMLSEKGISISEIEIKMLIESVVHEFNQSFTSEQTQTD